jgi:Eukaryotic protein of unknown function (DUF953)
LKKFQDKLNSDDLYQVFIKTWKKLARKIWSLAIFEGSPENGEYSWCPDCVVARSHISNFESKQKRGMSAARFLKFHVGNRKEWESRKQVNPFRGKFPYLSDLPTAILFYGRTDVLRVIAPQESDLDAMISRIRLYEKQIKNGDWHPPTK